MVEVVARRIPLVAGAAELFASLLAQPFFFALLLRLEPAVAKAGEERRDQHGGDDEGVRHLPASFTGGAEAEPRNGSIVLFSKAARWRRRRISPSSPSSSRSRSARAASSSERTDSSSFGSKPLRSSKRSSSTRSPISGPKRPR